MTATAAPVEIEPGRLIGRIFRAIPLRPVEGWLSLFSTVVMAFMLALSFQEAAWTPRSTSDTNFLPYLALTGLGFGVVGAKLGWGRWRTHLVGAAFAGLFLPLIVGGVVIGPQVGWDPAGLARRMLAALGVAQNVWNDLVVNGRPYTTEYAYYHLVFGAITWGAGMLAGFTVFGHRRPLDAVVVLGLVMLANMALTTHDQIVILIVFSAAALLLLIRSHVFEEEVTWARRRIGDPASIGQLYLVAGAQFVLVAVLGSILLTATASSAPLQGAFKDLPQRLEGISQWLQRFAPPNGDLRGPGTVTLGDHALTRGVWQPSNLVAFRAQFDTTEDRPFKWRLGTYSDYFLYGWNWVAGATRVESTPANGILLDGHTSGDRPTETGRSKITFKVIPDAYIGRSILGPNTLKSVDIATNVIVVGNDGWFTTVEFAETPSSYEVTALLQDKDGVTESQLRLAGTEYPAEIKSIYLALPEAAMGPDARALLARIRTQVVAPSYAESDNPYDLARTMQEYLRSPDHFKYQEDIRTERDAQCPGVVSTVECFARIKKGYCDYYASTMAVLLRASGVPARVAYGFLPGQRGTDGTEVVGASGAHYWVEVYFPGTGWIEFDPTGGNRGQVVAIPSGSVGPLPSRTPRPSSTPADITPLPTVPGNTGTITNRPNTGIGPFIAIAVILVVIVVALAYVALRRAPNRPMDPDKAWGSIARLAARVGLAPRASQTVYEYAGVLGDAVPSVRLELTTIARAKVEVAYGKRDLENDRLRRIAVAYQRLRFAILGVLLRRPFRRRRSRR